MDKLDEDLHEHQSDWERTVNDVKKVLQKYKLSEEPEDLQALIAYEADIHKFHVDLQEYFKDDMDIMQQIQSVAIEGLTATRREAKSIREKLDARSPAADLTKDALREMLVECPLASLALDQDHVFGKEFHEATNTQIRELTAKVDQLCARMIRDVDQIHAQLRAELKIENLEDRFQGYCALAELKVTQAMGERQRLQEENDRLKASKSKTNKSLTAGRKKTEALNKKVADAEARLAGAEARLAGVEDGKGKELALLEQLNEAREHRINTMQALLDQKDAKIQDLDVAAAEHESKVKSLEAKVSELEFANGDKNAKLQHLESYARTLEAAQK